MTVHVAAAKAERASFLHFFNQRLALDALYGEANDRNSQIFVLRRLAMDGYTVIASQKVQENLLQLLFVRGNFVPCGGEIRPEVFQDTWNALCQLIVGGSQVQL